MQCYGHFGKSTMGLAKAVGGVVVAVLRWLEWAFLASFDNYGYSLLERRKLARDGGHASYDLLSGRLYVHYKVDDGFDQKKWWSVRNTMYPIISSVRRVKECPSGLAALDQEILRAAVLKQKVPIGVSRQQWEAAINYSTLHPYDHHNQEWSTPNAWMRRAKSKCDMPAAAAARKQYLHIMFQVETAMGNDEIGPSNESVESITATVHIGAQYSALMDATGGYRPFFLFTWDESDKFIIYAWAPAGYSPDGTSPARSPGLRPLSLSPGGEVIDDRPPTSMFEIIGGDDPFNGKTYREPSCMAAVGVFHVDGLTGVSRYRDDASFPCRHSSKGWQRSCNCILTRDISNMRVRYGQGNLHCYMTPAQYRSQLENEVLPAINAHFGVNLKVRNVLKYSESTEPSDIFWLRSRVAVHIVKQLTIRCNCNRITGNCNKVVLGQDADELQGYDVDHYIKWPLAGDDFEIIGKEEHNRRKKLKPGDDGYLLGISSVCKSKDWNYIKEQLRFTRVCYSGHHLMGKGGDMIAAPDWW